MQENAIVIDVKDNVATALRQLGKGDPVQIDIEGETVEVVLIQDIPFGHKFALKYGETIGLAIQPIKKGEHVHVHNVESQKGRGDKQ